MSIEDLSRRAEAVVTSVDDGRVGWAAVQRVYTSGTASLLAAHRIARGWTLEETVKKAASLASLYAGPGGAVTAQMLCAWERGRVTPSLGKVDLLCRLYSTRPDRLGLLNDYSTEADDNGAPAGIPAPLPAADPLADLAIVQRFTGRRGTPVAAPVLDAMQGIRLHVDRALEQAEAAPTDLAPWRASAASYSRQHFSSPSPALLPKIFADIVALQRLLVHGRSAAYCRDVYQIQGQLGGLVGLNLIALGAPEESEGWYRTARTMAIAAGDRSLEAWIVAHHGFVPQAYRNARKALRFAREAQALSAATLWGLSVEARALVQLGRLHEAEVVQRQLSEKWAHLNMSAEADMMGYSEVYLRWGEGSVYSRGRNPMRGWHSLERAIALTPSTSVRFRAMQRAEQALALVNDGEIARACAAAQAIIDELEPWQRSGVVAAYLHEVADKIPPRYRGLTCVRDLQSTLSTIHASV